MGVGVYRFEEDPPTHRSAKPRNQRKMGRRPV
jgi:hypothetical protein